MLRAFAVVVALGLILAPSAFGADVIDTTARVLSVKEVAVGGRIEFSVRGIALPARIEERRGAGWVARGGPIGRRREAATRALRAPERARAWRLRARGRDGRVSRTVTVRVRPLRLDAVGDVNLGDGPGQAIAANGDAWPWQLVGPSLRAADIAFANLECAISVRGIAQDKQYTFRGRPSALRAAAVTGGIDVVNLANNHAGDFGDVALTDTLRHAREFGIRTVGAGADAAGAYRPLVVEHLGLKVAFVGFSEVLPYDFQAGPGDPGTAWAHPERIVAGVRAASRQADVVVATFHWGIERDRNESARQRQLATLAVDSGADAVIGAHPHVLQPIRANGRKLVAYSLGNFVFGASSPQTASTGVLELDLGAAGVLGHRFRPARIVGTRPVPTG